MSYYFKLLLEISNAINQSLLIVENAEIS